MTMTSSRQMVCKALLLAVGDELALCSSPAWKTAVLRGIEAAQLDSSQRECWIQLVQGPLDGLVGALRFVPEDSQEEVLDFFTEVLSLHRTMEVIADTLRIRATAAERQVWVSTAEKRLIDVRPRFGAA